MHILRAITYLSSVTSRSRELAENVARRFALCKGFWRDCEFGKGAGVGLLHLLYAGRSDMGGMVRLDSGGRRPAGAGAGVGFRAGHQLGPADAGWRLNPAYRDRWLGWRHSELESYVRRLLADARPGEWARFDAADADDAA